MPSNNATDPIEVLSLGIAETGEIWAGIRHAERVGAVLKIDADTGDVLTELDDIDIPAWIAFGFGSVWITDSGSSSLYRIDPGALSCGHGTTMARSRLLAEDPQTWTMLLERLVPNRFLDDEPDVMTAVQLDGGDWAACQPAWSN